MIGVLGWKPKDAWPLTLRDFILIYEAKVINDWDHTATTAALIHNLTVVVCQLGSGGKSKAKPKSMLHFHPFRAKRPQGLRITADSIQDLKMIGTIMAGG